MNKEFVPFFKRPSMQETLSNLQTLEPKILFHVAFGPHQTYREGRALSKKIQACDLFIPEAAGWNMFSRRKYNKTSYSGKLPRSIKFGPKNFKRGLFEALQGTHTPVRFIDYPSIHPAYAELRNLYQKNEHTPPHRKGKVLSAIADGQDRRDEYMLRQLPQVVKTFLHDNPTVATKEQVHVLLFLGGIHTRIYHALQEASPDSTRVFSKKPFIYEPENVAIRKILFGKTT